MTSKLVCYICLKDESNKIRDDAFQGKIKPGFWRMELRS